MSGFRSLYDILNVEASCSTENIRKAYKQKALETHPDKIPFGCSEEEKQLSETRFREVYEAFAVLSDPLKRLEYDIVLKIRLDYTKRWVTLDEQQARRTKEREEWERRAEERRQERLQAQREVNRLAREATRERLEEGLRRGRMSEKILRQILALERDGKLRKRKISRSKAEAPSDPANNALP